MKNKSTTAWIIIGVVLAVAGIVLLLLNTKKDINWDEHYKSGSKDPYGLFLIQELIADKYKGNTETIVKSLQKSLPQETSSRNNNYLYIGSALYLSNPDQKALFRFIENGNTAFIATKELPYSIAYLLKHGGIFTFDSTDFSIAYPLEKSNDTTTYLLKESDPDETYDTTSFIQHSYNNAESAIDTLAPEEITYDTVSSTVPYVDSNIINLHYIDDKEIYISLLKPLANSPKKYVFQRPRIHENAFIDSLSYHWLGIYCDTQLHPSCEILSKLSNSTKDTINTLIGIPYGKGMLYVCTTPMFFTNFQIKEAKGFSQAKELLSVLSTGKVYWDEVSNIQSSSDSSGGIDNPKAYLKYILSIDALRWAWYTLLAATIIYILFESKRKIRVIPIIEPFTNTSIEYVHTTGRLYAQIGNHRKLIQLNMRLFLSSIQQKYGISVNLDDTKSIEWLAMKSGIAAERYELLQQAYKRITVPGHDTTTKDLHTFYQNMQFIYQKIQN